MREETWKIYTTQLEDGTAGIAYQMGLLGLAPPEQFNGGAFQQYYDQGYHARANQGGNGYFETLKSNSWVI